MLVSLQRSEEIHGKTPTNQRHSLQVQALQCNVHLQGELSMLELASYYHLSLTSA